MLENQGCGDEAAHSKVKVNRVMKKTYPKIAGVFLKKETISITKCVQAIGPFLSDWYAYSKPALSAEKVRFAVLLLCPLTPDVLHLQFVPIPK